MSVSYGKSLASGSIMPTTAAALYTVGATINRVVINQATIVNYSGSASIFTIWLLQNGDIESDEHQRAVSVAIGAGETKFVTQIFGESIDTGGRIWGSAGDATALAFSAVGTEFTT